MNLLYQNRGQPCTREQCARAIWGEQYYGMETENFDKMFSGLRARLRQVDPEADCIEVRRSVGYVLLPV